MEKIVAIIPAKGNSERLPNKNILEINGRPMLAWAIKACQDSKYNIEPWVSSESDIVLDIAKKYGAKIYKRDPKLSEAKVFKQEVIRDAAAYILKNSEVSPTVFISLQANSPQITAKHLDDGLEVLLNSPKGTAMYEVFSVDKNYYQNAAFRMFRSHYVMQKDLSTHCAVVVCNVMDINTREDFECVKAIMENKTSQKVKWENIKRDTMCAPKIINKEDTKWYPTIAQVKEKNSVDRFIMEGWIPKIPFISLNTKIIAFGDCFVQCIIQFLINNKINVNMNNIKLFFYSSQFINTFSILEQIEWVMGKRSAEEIEYFRGNSTRTGSKKVVLSEEERVAAKKQFEITDVIILSFGVIETWMNLQGQSLWSKSLNDQKDEILRISSFEENRKNMDCIYKNLREINRHCDIIIQLSPIPINASFGDKSVVSANCLAKSTLKTVINDFYCQYKNDPNLHYFPSYEIANYLLKYPYDEDNRHLTSEATNIITGCFGKYYLRR